MFIPEILVLSIYIFFLAGVFLPKQEPDKTPEEELVEALDKYLLRANQNASDKDD